MNIHFKKKYIITMLIVLYSIMFTYLIQCMEYNSIRLNLDPKKTIGNIQYIAHGLQRCGLLLIYASQLTQTYGQETKAACYNACAQNCSVGGDDVICNLTTEKVILPLSLLAAGTFLLGNVVGCIATACPKK